MRPINQYDVMDAFIDNPTAFFRADVHAVTAQALHAVIAANLPEAARLRPPGSLAQRLLQRGALLHLHPHATDGNKPYRKRVRGELATFYLLNTPTALAWRDNYPKPANATASPLDYSAVLENEANAGRVLLACCWTTKAAYFRWREGKPKRKTA